MNHTAEKLFVIGSRPGMRDPRREANLPAADGPFLPDCRTGYDGHVLPMIPPGCSCTDILTE